MAKVSKSSEPKIKKTAENTVTSKKVVTKSSTAKVPSVDFNSTFFLKKENRTPSWHLIDANGKVLGRLATQIANILRGRHKAIYTPHTDTGDYVVVINAEKIKLTADKINTKIYTSYSGWIGGYKERTAKQVQQKNPALLIEYAVKGMLPKTKLARAMYKKLKVYAGTEHPHVAQIETAKAATKEA